MLVLLLFVVCFLLHLFLLLNWPLIYFCWIYFGFLFLISWNEHLLYFSLFSSLKYANKAINFPPSPALSLFTNFVVFFFNCMQVQNNFLFPFLFFQRSCIIWKCILESITQKHSFQRHRDFPITFPILILKPIYSVVREHYLFYFNPLKFAEMCILAQHIVKL